MSDAPELKPCPFCGDPMTRFGNGHVSHTNAPETCPIRNYALSAHLWSTRADLPPTLAQAMMVPEVRELVEAAEELLLQADEPDNGRYLRWACDNLRAALHSIKGEAE